MHLGLGLLLLFNIKINFINPHGEIKYNSGGCIDAAPPLF